MVVLLELEIHFLIIKRRDDPKGIFSTRIGRGVLDNIGYGSGDFMFKGLPAGVEYNPAFRGGGDKPRIPKDED